jgi:hypothetical protein
VIVDNLNVLGNAISPDKTDSPPVVDSDAALTISIRGQSLEPVPGNRGEVFQFFRVVEYSQFSSRDLRDISKLPAPRAMKQLLGCLRAEVSRSPLTERRYVRIQSRYV